MKENKYHTAIIMRREVKIDRRLPFHTTCCILRETITRIQNPRGKLPGVQTTTMRLTRDIKKGLPIKDIQVDIISTLGGLYTITITGTAERDMTEEVYEIIRGE